MELKILVTLTLYARLIPLAKNPPKGAIKDANNAKTIEWSWTGRIVTLLTPI
jgi:hypothetical protein